MSLGKVPLVLAFTLGWRTSLTAPNPPAHTDESLPTRSIDNTTYRWLVPTVTKTFSYFSAVAEIATILARVYPSSILSNHVLKVLVWNHHPHSALRAGDGLRPSTVTTIGCIMVVCGATLRWLTFRYLGRFFRFELSIQKDHRLITTGPYSIVRHPSYASMVVMSFPGWLLWNFGRGSWVRESGLLHMPLGWVVVGMVTVGFIIPIVALTYVRVGSEDEVLRRHFGREWEEWASRVKYRVIPGVWYSSNGSKPTSRNL